MAETLMVDQTASKQDIYEQILPQITSLIETEDDLIANLANICAVLDMAFGHLWTGFYIRKGKELVLGPFQGPLACTRIPVEPTPRGVCGACADQMKTLIVPDVDKFPGHIPCSSESRCEIVVPLIHDGKTHMVLDIDSRDLNMFDETDAAYLEKIMETIRQQHLK